MRKFLLFVMMGLGVAAVSSQFYPMLRDGDKTK
jgi:hypothetical protein